MRVIRVGTLFLAVLLTACTPINNEGIGALSGGVVGALLGSQVGGGAGQVAAAAGGALIGAYLGGRIGKYMDRQDKLEMQHALETAPVGKAVAWKNPDNGNKYRVQPTKTYYVKGDPCREYTTYATIAGNNEKIYGKACRQADGSWRVAN
ncbi:MAG: RT0821/Lpp0805 family surface protein [Legionellaceae bacterium]|nr:RT0821/Lpp0805 family surface protein [Legionellaceae bacterium]